MNWLKRSLVSPIGGACLSAFVSTLECMGHGKNLLRVLTYHRVDDINHEDPYNPNLISATPSEFESQMDLIADRKAAISLQELVDALAGRRALKPGAVLLTFDDANCCFARRAWPVLRARGLPVTVFVPTAYPNADRRFWWDRVHAAVFNTSAQAWSDGHRELELSTLPQKQIAVRTLTRIVKSMPHEDACELVDDVCESLGEVDFPNNVLTWKQLRELAAEGVTLAPHTRTHPLLSRVSIEQARSEVVGSLRDLQDQVGLVPKMIAYPAGDYDQRVVSMLAEEGFCGAFTVRRGINSISRTDRFRIRRINIGRGTTVPLLRAQLLPQTRHI